MICPQCRSAECYRSHRSGVTDFLFTVAGCRPWRCKGCEIRFYARRVALRFAHLVHCGKCGNFDLDRISRERVDEGTLLFAKRLLRFPAYRCDPCRERFFSIRPFQRILPSERPETEQEIPETVHTEG